MDKNQLTEWFTKNQDTLIKRGSMALGMLMLILALMYAVSIARDLGWL